MNKMLGIVMILSLLFHYDKSNAQQHEYMKKINDSTYESTQIFLTEDPQPIYRLELKDGKPFHGYEVTKELILGEFPLVNYYENAELKAQYSIDYIVKDQFESPFEYSLKSTFKNNKIENGYVYRELASNNIAFLFTDIYKNGELQTYQINTFAMHSFNRWIFELLDDTMVITTLGSDESIKIYKKDSIMMADYIQKGEVIESSFENIEIVEEGTASSYSVYYLGENNKLQLINLKHLGKTSVVSEENMLATIYLLFSFKYDGTVKDLFHYMSTITNMKDVEEFSFSKLLEPLVVPYTQQNLKGFVSYNDLGLIHQGSKITLNKDGSYTMETYEKGKLTRSEIIEDIEAYNPSFED